MIPTEVRKKIRQDLPHGYGKEIYLRMDSDGISIPNEQTVYNAVNRGTSNWTLWRYIVELADETRQQKEAVRSKLSFYSNKLEIAS